MRLIAEKYSKHILTPLGRAIMGFIVAGLLSYGVILPLVIIIRIAMGYDE